MGGETIEILNEHLESDETTDLEKAINSSMRKRMAFDDLIEKYLRGLNRDISGVGVIDALVVSRGRDGQEMTADPEELSLHITVALTVGLHSFFGGAIRETISEASQNHVGHTVALVSDVHLIFVLQRVAPQFLLKQPPLGSVLKITPSDRSLNLQYRD